MDDCCGKTHLCAGGSVLRAGEMAQLGALLENVGLTPAPTSIFNSIGTGYVHGTRTYTQTKQSATKLSQVS